MTQVLDSSSCEFTARYLDDVTLGDSVDILFEEVKAFKNRANAVGIKLNHAKCKILGLSTTYHTVWEAAGLGIPMRDASSSELQGSPLHSDNIDITLTKQVRVLDRFVERLSLFVES